MEIYRYASGLKRALTYIIDMTIIAIAASAISSLIYTSIGYTDSLALRLEEMMGYYTAALSGNVVADELIAAFNNVLYCMGIEYLVTIPLYVVLSFIYLEDQHVLNIINLAISGMTLLGYFTFGYQAIKQEFDRKFHL